MMRAARLDVNLYEEVEADTGATSQALTVVVIAAVASGIGAALGAAMDNSPATNPITGLLTGVLGGLIGWGAWSFVIFFVGTRLFGGTATYGELLRTLGFAYTPSILGILSFIPILGGLIGLAAGIWGLVTGFIAIRQALDLDNGKTIAAIIVGIVAYMIVLFILVSVFAMVGLGGAMMGV